MLIVLLAGIYGYSKRTSFLTAISLAQISEFSLIIVMLGFSMGHISQKMLSVTILAALITITFTSYLIKWDKAIYRKISNHIGFLEKIAAHKVKVGHSDTKIEPKDVVLFGCDRIGYSILNKLKKMDKSVLIVDFNPDVCRKLVTEDDSCLYGDVSDHEVLERIGLEKVQLIISTIPDEEDNLMIIKTAKQKNKKTAIFVTASQIEEALVLYQAGADYVILPHFLGGDHVSFLLEKFDNKFNKLLREKIKHINELNHRKKLGHQHPHGRR